MEQSKRKELQLTAAKARLLGVQMVHDAASGHPGGSMSCMDVLTYLYFAEMRVRICSQESAHKLSYCIGFLSFRQVNR